MNYFERLVLSGVKPEAAKEIVERYLSAGDLDGLESYVVLCESMATIL